MAEVKEVSLANLKHVNERPKEEFMAISSKGGKNSGAARRERKRIRDTLEDMLSHGTTQEDIVAAILEKALGGDVRAFETIRDTVGEKPADRLEVEDTELRINIKVEE